VWATAGRLASTPAFRPGILPQIAWWPDSSSNAAEYRAQVVPGALGSIPNMFFRAAVLARWRKMRMKFNKLSQLLLVSAAGLLVAGLMTACEVLTVDFVFVASSKAAGPNNYGEMDVFEINSESGAMRQIPTSPFPSGGRNPVAEAVSSDNTNLFVVNQDDNSIVQFIIGNDGKLYPQNTINTAGIYPLAVAVSGANLFVLDTYQPLPICSTAAPCSGSVAVYGITSNGNTPPSDALGAPLTNPSLGTNYWPLSLTGSNAGHVIVPTALNVLASGASLYVTAYDSTASPNVGYVFGFSIGSDGTLTPLNGGVPLPAGIHPSGVASDSTNSFVYVSDFATGQVLAYAINGGSLTPLSGSPFQAGNQPAAIVVDPKYPYAYVANSLDSTVTAYSIGSGGALSSLGTYSTGSQPVAIGIDPSTNHFVFTANYLGSGVSGTVSGFELDPTAGTLVNSQNSPYLANAFPTAVAAIPHNGTSQ
jgi:6-phosphogluconolactonase